MKKVICGITAATIATTCCLSPVLAFADSSDTFGDYLDVVEWVYTLSGSDAAAYSSTGSLAAGGVIVGIEMACYMLDNPTIGGSDPIHIDADAFKGATGLYVDQNGDYKLGFVCIPTGRAFASDGAFVFATGADFDIGATTTNAAHVNISTQTDDYSYITYDLGFGAQTIIHNSKNQSYLSGDGGTRYNGSLTTFSVLLGSGSAPSLYGSSCSTYFTGNYSAPGFLGRGISFTLPEGDMIPADPSYYIDNTLRPWVESEYPDYVYLLPEPAPEPPQYETEFVTGIPKSWTIINPQLPSIPDINIQLPTIDFPSLPDTSGISNLKVGFWWSLFDEILTRSTLKWLFLAIPVIGLAVYAVWKLGD